jgi:LPS O-antigen subunit length determinant protein (WzzB/FepE family)
LRNNGYVITGDENIAIVSASVKYVISDPVAYALHVKSIPDTINAFVSTAMVNQAAGLTADELLTSGKDAFAKAVMEQAQAKLSLVEAGVTIGTLELTTVAMPSEVRDTYEMVTSAMVSANTQLEQAKISVKETMPVLTVIKPVTVPYKKSKPQRAMILFAFTFLGIVAGMGCVLLLPVLGDITGSERIKLLVKALPEKPTNEVVA